MSKPIEPPLAHRQGGSFTKLGLLGAVILLTALGYWQLGDMLSLGQLLTGFAVLGLLPLAIKKAFTYFAPGKNACSCDKQQYHPPAAAPAATIADPKTQTIQ